MALAASVLAQIVASHLLSAGGVPPLSHEFQLAEVELNPDLNGFGSMAIDPLKPCKVLGLASGGRQFARIACSGSGAC